MKNIYLPEIIGQGYKKFWNDTNRYRVLKGGKGSKKSATTALNYIFRIMKYPDSNLLVVRAVMNTHRDSTFAQLKWAQEKLGVTHLWRNTVSPMEMTYLPTGQKILFRGFDDVLKLASTTVSKGYLCWVWIEEAYEIPNEDDFDKLDMSVPRGEVPEHLFKQTTLTFNPWSERHWLKSRFFDTPQSNVSTYSTNYLINEFLDKTDIAVFEQMKEKNYRKYAVAGLGEWGVAENLVFENWQTLDFDENKLGADDGTEWQYKHFFGLDFGYVHDPTAFIALAANPITKEIFIYDEFYERKLLNSDIAAMIKKKGYAKERIRADAAEPKSIDDLRRLGIQRVFPSIKGRDSIVNGITAVQEYKIYVKPTCANTIIELNTYRWDTDKSDNGINKPIDTDNHLMDALRYAMYDVRFFRPDNPNIKRKTTAEERYNRSQRVNSEDVLGGWEG